MAFAIPKIQYKNVDTTGNTTNGDDDITNIPDTTDIEVGMFARGVGVPAGATVLSKTSSSVKLAGGVQATITDTGVALAFGFEIEFAYPPKESNGEELETKQTTSESLSGIRQVSTNYLEAARSLVFSFLSQTLKEQVDTFLKTHAMFGESFRYYENKTLTNYVSYELDKLKATPKKLAPKGEIAGVDQYLWEYPLAFRRIV